MIYSKRKAFLLIALLIISLSFFGCGDDKGTGAGDKSENVTASAEETSDIATAPAVSTKEAVASDDAVSGKNDAKKEETKPKSEKSASEKSGTTKKNSTEPDKSSNIKCTISIDCKTLYNKDPDIAQKVSNKGSVLGAKSLTLKKNSSVYDALKATGLSFSGKSYISMINGLSEKDGGKLSGWLYFVNGSSPSESCDQYKLKDGDKIQWRYTCNGGDDL